MSRITISLTPEQAELYREAIAKVHAPTLVLDIYSTPLDRLYHALDPHDSQIRELLNAGFDSLDDDPILDALP